MMPSVANSSAHLRRDPDAALEQRVWVLRKHHRVSLRQAHAIVSVDWDAGLARTACGMGLRPDAIGDVPEGGCMPCVSCVAAMPVGAALPEDAAS
ncbi:hypothetical protein [Saccharopolyspora gloriosae]|uniref:hypothetical protein n=1 Tax=Saccharopolyspora gloriosae TaxID=455344 RepID=UPI001FB5AC74|nr:hypothetical protein [Saccharopolyspora gloriosae]